MNEVQDEKLFCDVCGQSLVCMCYLSYVYFCSEYYGE